MTVAILPAMHHRVTACWLVAIASCAASAASQRLLLDAEPGSRGSFAQSFATFDGGFVFRAITAAHGTELWRSDGTPGGTGPIDLVPGPGGSFPSATTASLGQRAVFFAHAPRAGFYSTDGTVAGTRIESAYGFSPADVDVHFHHELVGGRLYALLRNARRLEMELHAFDRSGRGRQLLTFHIGDFIGRVANRLVIHTLDRSSRTTVWVTDGTPNGTSQLQSFASRGVYRGAGSDARAFFVTGPGAGPTLDLWVTDGTSAGTRRVTTLPDYPTSQIATWRGRAFFTVHVLGTGTSFTQELWTSDGTAAGTTRVLGFQNVYISGYITLEHTVAFVVGRPNIAHTIWRTDGTTAGTVAAWPLTGRLIVTHISRVIGQNRMLLTARYGVTGLEPWWFDGTTARPLADIAPGPDDSLAADYTVAADLAIGPALLFTARTMQHGREPWIAPLASIGAAVVVDAARDGCAQAGAIPEIHSAGGAARIGNATFRIDVESTHAGRPAILFADFTKSPASARGCATDLPTPFGVGGMTDASGRLRINLPIPNNPALIGGRFFTHGVVVVPGGALFGLADRTHLRVVVVGS